MNFDLKKPCKDCPFTKGTAMVLGPGRMAGIAASLRRDTTVFPCHKHTEHNEDGQARRSAGDQACMGALAYQMKHLRQIPVMARLAMGAGKITRETIRSQFTKIEDPGKWETE